MLLSLVFAAAVCTVRVESSAEYVSPYSIPSIACQEAIGLADCVIHDDRLGDVLIADSMGDVIDAARSIAGSVECGRLDGGIWYSYGFRYRGLDIKRETYIRSGRVTLVTSIGGAIRTEVVSRGPAVATVRLVRVVLTQDALERDGATACRAGVSAELSVVVRGKSRCWIVNGIVRRRGGPIADAEVRREVSLRAASACNEIIRVGRSVAESGRATPVWRRIAERGLLFKER